MHKALCIMSPRWVSGDEVQFADVITSRLVHEQKKMKCSTSTGTCLFPTISSHSTSLSEPLRTWEFTLKLPMFSGLLVHHLYL